MICLSRCNNTNIMAECLIQYMAGIIWFCIFEVKIFIEPIIILECDVISSIETFFFPSQIAARSIDQSEDTPTFEKSVLPNASDTRLF